MILQALNDYYERLAADPESDVAAFGFSRQQIGFEVVLEKDGTLHKIQDARQADDKGKLRNQSLIVTGNAKPSGSGINPCFLWDNAAYALGYKPDDKKPERTREAFEAFSDRHLEVEEAIEDEGFSAVCNFLKSWDPAEAEKHDVLKELKTGFGVFRIRAAKSYIHERKKVLDWWNAQLAAAEASEDDVVGQCLVTGEVGPLARIHEPKIKGVYGGQSSGTALVSFNCKSFESYGKEQSIGSPVGEQVAFQYTTALNRLLDKSSGRRMSVGDTSVVFWTEKPSPAEDVITALMNPNLKPTDDKEATAEDQAQLNHLRKIIDAIAQGSFPTELGKPETQFYMLGLAPNAARVSIRFWHVSTLGDFIENLHRHYAGLEIERTERDQPHPPLWRLLRETVRDTKDLPDLLEGALLRAILTGQPYPQMFYAALLRRIQADREVRYVRAAAIKAVLNRNYQQELPVSLDPKHSEPAYQLGRLFAELEKTQEDALPGINDTIKDRYFGSASATPGSVFPRILRMSQHHLGKLEKGAKTYHEKRIQEIVSQVDSFPSHFAMKEQGLFAIGYYHQRQDLFTKKAKADDGPEGKATK